MTVRRLLILAAVALAGLLTLFFVPATTTGPAWLSALVVVVPVAVVGVLLTRFGRRRRDQQVIARTLAAQEAEDARRAAVALAWDGPGPENLARSARDWRAVADALSGATADAGPRLRLHRVDGYDVLRIVTELEIAAANDGVPTRAQRLNPDTRHLIETGTDPEHLARVRESVDYARGEGAWEGRWIEVVTQARSQIARAKTSADNLPRDYVSPVQREEWSQAMEAVLTDIETADRHVRDGLSPLIGQATIKESLHRFTAYLRQRSVAVAAELTSEQRDHLRTAYLPPRRGRSDYDITSLIASAVLASYVQQVNQTAGWGFTPDHVSSSPTNDPPTT